MLLNQVRESGDHANFNSWDRVPYIADHGDGSNATVVPHTRTHRWNLWLGLYSSQSNVNNDDGSNHYDAFVNGARRGNERPGGGGAQRRAPRFASLSRTARSPHPRAQFSSTVRAGRRATSAATT